MNCTKCHNIQCVCDTSNTTTNVVSDQAGRDGLDAKEILIRSAQLPKGASDIDFKNAIKGDSNYQIAVRNGYKGTEKEWITEQENNQQFSPQNATEVFGL